MTATFTSSVKPRPGELAEEELVARQGLGQQGVERAPLDLLADQAHADEDRDQGAEQLHGRQPDVLDDLLVLPDRELARAGGRTGS